jgi:hypothetical protein
VTDVTNIGCTVEDSGNGQTITCGDQVAFIPNQEYIKEVVDPCGDGEGADEVLLFFDDGSVVAWYHNLGLSVLEEFTPYRTTDKQKCEFEIQNGELVEYE